MNYLQVEVVQHKVLNFFRHCKLILDLKIGLEFLNIYN